MEPIKNIIYGITAIVGFLIVWCLVKYKNCTTTIGLRPGLPKSKSTKKTTNLMTLCRQHAEEEDEELLKILEKIFEKHKIDEDTKLLNIHIHTLLEKFKFDNETHKKRFITIRALIRKQKIEKRNEYKKLALNRFEVKQLSWDQVAQLFHAEIEGTEKEFENWCNFLEKDRITGKVLLNMGPEEKEEYMEKLGLVERQRVMFETMMDTINNKATEKSRSNSSSHTALDNSNVQAHTVTIYFNDPKQVNKNSEGDSNGILDDDQYTK